MNVNFKKNSLAKLTFLMLFFVQFSFAQLSNFTLIVSRTNETCTSNGTISYTVSGTTAGSNMVYSIYKLPNTTVPISVQSSLTLVGLTAGNYRVIATQSLAGQPNGVQQQDVTITNQIAVLNYTLSSIPFCNADGTIAVTTTSGTSVGYEILTGPVTRPLQTSSVFNFLTAGTYQVRVFDACGDAVVKTITIVAAPSCNGGGGTTPPEIYTTGNNTVLTCNTIRVRNGFKVTPPDVISYPISIVYTVFPPTGGSPIVYPAQVLTTGNTVNQTFSEVIALYPNVAYSYNITITDSTGAVFTKTFSIYIDTVPKEVVTETNCAWTSYLFTDTTSVSLISYTAPGYPVPPANAPVLPYVLPIVATFPTIIKLTPGTYNFIMIDICGNPIPKTVTVSPNVIVPYFGTIVGCNPNSGSIAASLPNYTSLILTSAPASYTGGTLPQNLTSSIGALPNGDFYLENIQTGTYVFTTINQCGVSKTTSVNLVGYEDSPTNINVIEHCGSFDLGLYHTSNTNAFSNFWLQKWDPVSSQWVHPVTGVVYAANTTPTALNSIQLTNNFVNLNYSFTGQFRVLKVFALITSGPTSSCIKTIKEFEFTGQPKLIDVYTIACNNGTYDAIVTATGPAPLLYRITTKNGLPFVVQNGNSSVFIGLAPATYNFQVEDVCQNLVNSVKDIPRPFVFVITPTYTCNGQAASLSVPDFPFLQYQWYKGTNTTPVLSTTGTLNFPIFNAPNDNGVYHVRIKYASNASSCIDFVLDYTFNIPSGNPNAGQDNTLSYCGAQSTLNLNTLLLGTFDSGGVWTETSASVSGALTGNTWNSASVAPGTYQFKYKIITACGTFDESFVNITIKPIPVAATVTPNFNLCIGQPLNLTASTIAGATYSWTGPNGYISALQNPTIASVAALNAGNYVVKATVNGCPSLTSTSTVIVGNTPYAGLDNTLSYCGTQSTFNLNTLLLGTFDAGGVWSETSTSVSGTLTGNNWDSSAVPSGVYQFKYKVTSGCGTFDEALINITIKPIPILPTVTPNFNLCVGQSLNLTATSSAGATYSWTGPNGFTSTLQNPTIANIAAVNAGNYIVKATVNGCQSLTSTSVVAVGNNPNAGLDNTLSYCGAQSIFNLNTLLLGTFDAGGNWTETSTFVSGTLTANNWNSSTVPSGTYQFKYKVTSGCGTFDEALVNITIKPIPFAPTVTPNFNLCATQTLNLTAASITGATYAWSGPNGYTSNQQNPTIPSLTAQNAGNYTVIATLNNCPSVSSTSIVVVNPAPRVGTGTNPSYCGTNGTIDLFSLLTGGYDLGGTWTETSTAISGTLTGSLWNSTTLVAGNYQFKYKITSTCGLAPESVVNVTLNAIPNAPVATASTLVCSGQPFNLFATNIVGATYSWTGPNGFTSNLQNPTIANATTQSGGSYTVKSTSNGCTSSTTSVSITLKPSPDFIIEGECLQNKFQVIATPVGNSYVPSTAMYSWSGPNGFASSDNPVDLTNKDRGIYSLSITNTEGCVTKKDIDLQTLICETPKGVSPNGDGLNDNFDLSGLGEILKFKIFNRYGESIYEQDNYKREWHGQDYNDNLLPIATYYYYVRLSSGVEKTGWVYLNY